MATSLAIPSNMLLRAAVVAVLVFVLDRLTKIWVVEVLDLRSRGSIPVLDPWLTFTMAWNQGINFGLFDLGPGAGRWLLVAVALAIVVALALWVRRAQGWMPALGVGAIIGGALGNVWDRLRYGAVADFINMSCCGIRNPFAFNLADAAIFGGAMLLVFFGHRTPGATGRDAPGGLR